MIYLASPIDFWPDTKVSPIQSIKTALLSVGEPVFDPKAYWKDRRASFASMQSSNYGVLKTCNAMVAVIPKDVTSLGVPSEVNTAVHGAIPVYILTDINPEESVMLGYWESLGARIYTEENDLLDDLLARVDHHMIEVVGKWAGDGVAPRLGKAGDAGFDLTTKTDDTICGI